MWIQCLYLQSMKNEEILKQCSYVYNLVYISHSKCLATFIVFTTRQAHFDFFFFLSDTLVFVICTRHNVAETCMTFEHKILSDTLSHSCTLNGEKNYTINVNKDWWERKKVTRVWINLTITKWQICYLFFGGL